MKLLVTGGAGFIGSNFIRYLLRGHPDWEVVNLDKLTYAGNLDNLVEVAGDPRYTFVQGDICDVEAARGAARGCDAIVNFAAESHVDRSIADPGGFLRTDIFGVHVLLEVARELGIRRVLQISTDEVYGPIEQGAFREDDRLRPGNPYAASKAGGELLAHSYWKTYGAPVIISRATNNLGPHQYPEKMASLFITNALEDQPLPVYGDGRQMRDWMHVEDHCRACELLLERGEPGEIYNIGGTPTATNIEIATMILDALGKPHDLITHVKDRPGHDRRYAVDASKLRALGWAPTYDLKSALAATVEWYRENQAWWRKIKSGEFLEYYRRQYGL
ncbi:MAG TPA: dTDP-glucose 4,6-dehydratase [Armatimonadota bacterium]|nr:dTDP-glucose 4,6-dehydratase [Armatimonadota bacterium]